uniref:Uncharacterized protein n=1 Tax=Onchocerca volvulus TaxID=6282 RepID=A0A8R1TJX4_ONCVO
MLMHSSWSFSKNRGEVVKPITTLTIFIGASKITLMIIIDFFWSAIFEERQFLEITNRMTDDQMERYAACDIVKLWNYEQTKGRYQGITSINYQSQTFLSSPGGKLWLNSDYFQKRFTRNANCIPLLSGRSQTNSSLYSKHFDKRGRAEKNHSESPSSTDSTTNLDPEIRIACIHKSHLSLSHSQLPK